jgi:MFS family permease
MSFATNGGTIVAPLVIGFSAQMVGNQASFVTIGVLTLLYTALGLLLPDVRVPKTTKQRGSSGGLGLAFNLLRLQGMQVVLQLTFVRLWNTTAWGAFYSVYLKHQGFDPLTIGSIISVGNVVSTAVTLTAGWFAARSSSALATAFALGLGTLGVALSPFLLEMPWVYIPSILVGFGVGLSLPLLVVTVSEEAPPDQRGVALGLRMSVNQGAGTVAPMAAGVVAAALAPALGFLFSAGVSGVLLGSAVWMHLASRRQRAAPAAVSAPPS